MLGPSKTSWIFERSCHRLRVNDGEVISEHPILTYTFIKPDGFVKAIPRLREFLHRLGRETNQVEVAVESDNRFSGYTTSVGREGSHRDQEDQRHEPGVAAY